jgi:hypothetical protein
VDQKAEQVAVEDQNHPLQTVIKAHHVLKVRWSPNIQAQSLALRKRLAQLLHIKLLFMTANRLVPWSTIVLLRSSVTIRTFAS